MAAPPKPPSPSDWLRWSPAAREAIHRAAANVPPGWAARASDRRKVVAAIVAASVAEADALAGNLIAGSTTPARWRAAARDSLATHSLAATVAILGISDDGGQTVPSLYDALPGADAASMGRLLASLLDDLDRILKALRSGTLLLGRPPSDDEPVTAAAVSEFRREALTAARSALDVAGAVKAGRDAAADVAASGSLDRAMLLWKRLAPPWAAGLIDATNGPDFGEPGSAEDDG